VSKWKNRCYDITPTIDIYNCSCPSFFIHFYTISDIQRGAYFSVPWPAEETENRCNPVYVQFQHCLWLAYESVSSKHCCPITFYTLVRCIALKRIARQHCTIRYRTSRPISVYNTISLRYSVYTLNLQIVPRTQRRTRAILFSRQ